MLDENLISFFFCEYLNSMLFKRESKTLYHCCNQYFFSGEYFITPLYSLGAALIPKSWLIKSPFDEFLDPHGIGEHYGVIAGFPSQKIHVLNNAFVYHHHEEANRLQKSLQYYRRVLALDYYPANSTPPTVKIIPVMKYGYTESRSGDKSLCADIRYQNYTKQIDFSEYELTDSNRFHHVQLQTTPGYLGFEVIRSKKLVK